MRRSTPVAIRRATALDAEALGQLERSSRGTDGAWSDEINWPALFAETGVFSYLAEDDRPFGVVSVGTPREDLYGNAGEVIAWYLEPEYWAEGFGRKLLVHGLTVMKRRNFERAFVSIPETSENALETVWQLQFEQHSIKPVGDTNLLMFLRDLDDYF